MLRLLCEFRCVDYPAGSMRPQLLAVTHAAFCASDFS